MVAVEESPGSTRERCRLTAGGGDPRESATENKPPVRGSGQPGQGLRARVKRCGKSAPRFRQRRRQGKPHREQDRIGAAGRMPRDHTRGVRQRSFASSPGLVARGTQQCVSQRNDRLVASGLPGAADRTRLTGRLAPTTPMQTSSRMAARQPGRGRTRIRCRPDIPRLQHEAASMPAGVPRAACTVQAIIDPEQITNLRFDLISI